MKRKADITIIFPMAGKSSRFGYKFKPFLKVEDKTFIELAFESFKNWEEYIKEVIFIFLEEQEREYNVTIRLKELFPDLNYRVVILEKETSGPVETVKNAIDKADIKGKVVLCDCDHYVNVSPIFEYLKNNEMEECILPLWKIKGEDIKSWGIASVSENWTIKEITEKKLPRTPGEFFGVVGCYFFKDAKVINKEKIYVSEIIQELIKDGKLVRGIEIHDAEFFGDPQRLQEVLDKRKKKVGTIFCDIDGTLVEHENIPNYTTPLKVLPGTLEKLQKWNKEGYKIILITSRKEEDKEKLKKSLEEAGIIYHDLIMNLPSGTRYLINDRKPSSMLTQRAVAFEIERNQGIGKIEIDPDKIIVLKEFSSGSFSKIVLIEKSGKMIVRKVVSKQNNLSLGYSRLRRQYSDLQRFMRLDPSLVPKVYGECENSFEYYFDMEFLSDYERLSNYPPSDKLRVVKNILLPKMYTKIYSNKVDMPESGNAWLSNHFSNKIYPKITKEQLPQKLFQLVDSGKVIIDGKDYLGLSSLLEKAMSKPYINVLKPSYLCPVHGDLTFENIMYAESVYNPINKCYEQDIKILDMDGAEFIDAPELDLGKMFQSIISQYESWSVMNLRLVEINDKNELSLNFKEDEELLKDLDGYISAWSSIIEGDNQIIKIKAYFYMALHLIRMIPFRLKVSEDQAMYALATAIKYMSKSLDMIDEKRE